MEIATTFPPKSSAKVMAKFVLLIWMLSISAYASHLTGISSETKSHIDDVIAKSFLPAGNISKLGLAIVKDDGDILYTTGYGYANVEKAILIGSNTQFLVGSITKTFTAVIVAKSLNDLFPNLGEKVLDTPICHLVPTANFTLIDRFRSEYATFRDILSHRMCLSRDDYSLVSGYFSKPSDVVFSQRYSAEACSFRSEFEYNNQMFVVAAELIEQLVGKTYTELLNKLLADIGMENSQLISELDDFSKMPLRAQPYYVLNGKSYHGNTQLLKRLVPYAPAGGLISSPNDMARFMRFYLNKGSFDGKQIVDKNVMEWLLKPSIPVQGIQYCGLNPKVKIFNYGAGILLGTYGGLEYNRHPGFFPPYACLMSFFPDKDVGIFTCTSEGPALVDSHGLHTYLFEVIQGNTDQELVPNWNKQAVDKRKEQEKKEKAIDMHVKMAKLQNKHHIESNIIGKYQSGSSGVVTVSAKFNPETKRIGYYMSYGKWSQGWLENAGGPIYKVFWSTDYVHDNYAMGDTRNHGFLRILNETLELIAIDNEDKIYPLLTFRTGVCVESLPVIPWKPDSC